MCAADQQALTQRGRWRQRGLLLDKCDAQGVAESQLAVVQMRTSGDDLQQRRLAGAVAPDETDALAVENRRPRGVEQRGVAVREMSVEEGEHCARRLPETAPGATEPGSPGKRSADG